MENRSTIKIDVPSSANTSGGRFSTKTAIIIFSIIFLGCVVFAIFWGIQLVSKVAEVSKGVALTDIQQAKLLWSEGKYVEMIPVATHALSIANTNEERVYAYYWRGVGYYKQGMDAEALADENNAIALDPTFSGPYITRSGVYADKGDYQAEFNDAQKAVQLDPTYAWAYNAMGNAYLDLGDKVNAIKGFQEAIRLDPETSLFRLNLTRAQEK